MIDEAVIDRGNTFIDDRGRCRRRHTEHFLERRVWEVEAEVASLEETKRGF